MTRLEQELMEQLKTEFASLTTTELIDRLFAGDMLNYRGVECRAIYRHYTMLLGRGCAKCRAMDEVANHYGCSYEKVRAIIYAQNKKETNENGTEN